MRALQGVKVSSTMTKLNPRPRKYASASDRQAAYRARAPEMCLRAESKTVDTLDKIAADLDISRADLLLSMTKFALANHDWARFGLTHKPLPFEYGIEKENIAMNPLPIWLRPRPKNLGKSIPLTAAQKRKAKSLAAAAGRNYPNLVDNIAASRNPTMKKPSPAQIAARKKFAEMARSGALNRKRQISSKTNPMQKFTVLHRGTANVAGQVIASGAKAAKQKVAEKLGIPTLSYLVAKKTNPAKKTVAIAMSEQRKGKIKSNPSKFTQSQLNKLREEYSVIQGIDPGSNSYIALTKKLDALSLPLLQQLESAKIKFISSLARNRVNRASMQKTNPATGRKGSRTLLNPMAAPVKSNSYSNFKYCVEAKRSLGSAGSVFETVAMFATKAQAQDYANAILKSHPSVTLRIKTYK